MDLLARWFSRKKLNEDQKQQCPYVVGNTITLQFKTLTPTLPNQQKTVQAVITETFEPFTLSCVMVVRLLDPIPTMAAAEPSSSKEAPALVVLKVFDRRFAAQLRKDYITGPWDMEIEEVYHQYILNGGAEKCLVEIAEEEKRNEEYGEDDGSDEDDDSDDEDDEEDDDGAVDETYLHYRMQKLYTTEIQVYETLQHIQQRHIPSLLATVTLPVPSSSTFTTSSQEEKDSINEYAAIPAILLQYIDGFPLGDLSQHAPRETWQTICEEAIKIIHLITAEGVLNEDVKTRNFIVSWGRDWDRDHACTYMVFMIDFALCRFRWECMNDYVWWGWKADQDEEGAVGVVMERYLEGGYVYRRSELYEKLDDYYLGKESESEVSQDSLD